ncbi:MAG: hypothetical protein KF757_09810 [Phycisphaeraceae bacterium]|nr:hypothetical protein [Phycisphaeraceae bacterium]MCW5763507.1 hypothetical protein [Phycisphaeraceae bacterium]
MGANRSRTARWRECLEQILDRGGGIEIAVRGGGTENNQGAESSDLLWRVRLFAIEAESMTVEMPGAMGQSYSIDIGTSLIGVMAIGQNRWRFESKVVGIAATHAGRREFPALMIGLPENVQRCRRRVMERLSTSEVLLPEVRCWTLLDPESAIPAEVANQARMHELHKTKCSQPASVQLEAVLLPAVGPESKCLLANIGGGGVGLQFEKGQCPDLDSRSVYWLRLDLRPWLPSPLSVTARLAHSYCDAMGTVHAGFAFDFSHNPSHRAFVLEQIGVCMKAMQQRVAA